MKNEVYVKRGFFRKVREAMADIEFVEEAVALYFCAIDRQTPLWVKIAAFAALAYFISPLDAMPDPVYIDDAGVIFQAYALVRAFVAEAHRSRARAWIAGVGLQVA